MQITDYTQLKSHLEQARQGFQGEFRSLLHPFEMPKCRGFSKLPINLSEFHKLMKRLIEYERGPAYVRVCVKTAIQWLVEAYESDRNLGRTPASPRVVQILNDWTQVWSAYNGAELREHWKRLLRCFVARGNEVVNVVADRKAWEIYGRYCGGWEWFYYWADVYKELVRKPQKLWLPVFWEQCLCRLAVKLGPKRKKKHGNPRTEEELSLKHVMT